MEYFIRTYGDIFKEFTLCNETYSWYFRRKAQRPTSSDDQKLDYLKEVYSNDKKMISALLIEENAGVYVSFASTIAEALKIEQNSKHVFWSSSEKRLNDWNRAVASMDQVVKIYRETWHTESDYGKHHFIWGELLLYSPETGDKESLLQNIKKAEVQFDLAIQYENPG